MGDVYQLTVNSTGSGNSGGPVFNDRGEVVAIFYAGRAYGGAQVTFAVPIRYALALLGDSSAAK
jgi:S1-C subfamily serine protease